MIRKTSRGYRVVSESGRNLGESPTRGGAENRLRQVEYFKHRDAARARPRRGAHR